jgi:hypothetical protein
VFKPLSLMQMRFMKKLHLLVLLLLAFTSSNATTHLVTNHNDSGAGSLRNANDISAPFDTIRFSPSLVSAGNDTIKLLSQITINNKLVFIGLRSPNNTLYISGQNTVRIFTVIGTGSTFDSLALINGRATVGGAIYAVSTGAMIQVKNCILQKQHRHTARGCHPFLQWRFANNQLRCFLQHRHHRGWSGVLSNWSSVIDKRFVFHL